MKKFLPMFLVAVSFCLISCGNKTANETDLNNAPEVTIEATDNQNLDENNDMSAPDDTAAPEESVSPEAAE